MMEGEEEHRCMRTAQADEERLCGMRMVQAEEPVCTSIRMR